MDRSSGHELIVSLVHKARPDVICVAHAHSLYGRSFSALEIDLPILNQDACAFHKVPLPSEVGSSDGCKTLTDDERILRLSASKV